MGPRGETAGGGSPGAGGARGKGHPMFGLEHPGPGVVRATGREGPGRKAETQRCPPGRAPGLVGPKHSGKAGAGLIPLEMGYAQKRLQGKAECICRRGGEHRGKNGGERDGK